MLFVLCCRTDRCTDTILSRMCYCQVGIRLKICIHRQLLFLKIYNVCDKYIDIYSTHQSHFKEKKKEIWSSPMTKPPIPTENSKTKWQHTNANKTSITQWLRTRLVRLRTVSWSNKSSRWMDNVCILSANITSKSVFIARKGNKIWF